MTHAVALYVIFVFECERKSIDCVATDVVVAPVARLPFVVIFVFCVCAYRMQKLLFIKRNKLMVSSMVYATCHEPNHKL